MEGSTKISSGSAVIDSILEGGYPTGGVNTIYGPAATGKTTACLLAAISCIRNGKKALIVDTEGGFSAERLKQLAPMDHIHILENIMIVRIESFEEQSRKLGQACEIALNNRIGLLAVDTIGCHYRKSRTDDNYRPTNAELQLQIDLLVGVTEKRKDLCVLMTNQVYANMDKENEIVPVGGDIIKRRSHCLIEFSSLISPRRMASLLAHPSITAGKQIEYEITMNGFE